MSNKIALATIQFKADAKGANAALESMRQSAKETEQKVADLQRAFDNGMKTMKDANGVEFNVAEELKRAKAEAKSFNDGIAQLIKGATALESVVKNIRLGEIEKNTRGELKGALNALDMRRRNLKEESPDYAERKKDFDDAEAEIKKQINRIDHDTDRLLKTLSEGGSVAKEVIDKEMKGLEDILKLIPETTEEWKKYAAQLKEIRGYVDEMNKQELKQTASILGDQNLGQYNETQIREAIKAGEQLIKTYETASPEAKRLAEEIVRAEEHLEQYGTKAERAARREAKAVEDAAERRRKSDEMMQQQLQKGTNLTESALKQQEQYWRKLIDDPKTAAESLQQYEANLAHVKSLQEQMASDAIRTKGEEALSFFRGNTSDASADTIQTQAKALKAYRDSLPQQTEASVIQEINGYITQSGEAAKIAAGEAMTLDEALKVSSTAGKEGFKGTQKQLEQAEQALQKAVENTKKGSSKWKEYKAALSAVRLEMDNASMTSERMHAILGNSRSAKNIDELRNAVKRADAELRHMSDTVGTNNTQYEKLASSTKKAKQELKRMEEQSSASGTAFEKAISRLKTYVGVYVSAAVAMQKIIGTMDDLMELSDKMGEVRKTTGFTADEVGRLTTALAKMDTRTSLVGLEELAAVAGQLGLKTEQDVRGFTEAANMLMVALPEMGKEGATAMLKVALATGEIEKIRQQMQQGLVEGSDAVSVAMTKIGSTIDALRANSASAAPAITDFVKRVGAVGVQSGITIDQVAALGSTVDALGLRVEMSATALSRMIPAIRNNAFEIGKTIGISQERIEQMYKEGRAMQVIIMLLEKMRGMSAEDIEGTLNIGGMAEVLKALNQQGARAGIVFAGLSQNVDELKRQLGVASKAYEENTAIFAEYTKMNETTAAKWARLKNDIEEMFVSDWGQRKLGGVIDALRSFVAWFKEDGPLAKGFKLLMSYLIAFKLGIGSTFAGAGVALKNLGMAFGALANVAGMALGKVGASLGLVTARTRLARMEWKKLDATIKANIWGAALSALAYVAVKLWDIHQAAKEAAAEVGRFNQKLSDEKKVLDDLFTPLEKCSAAQEERSRLISEINSKYSKYLGYIVSETTQAIQLAEAHALIAKRIREEAYEKRILEQEGKVRSEHADEMNAAYGNIEGAVRRGVRGNVDVSSIADALKGYVDRNIGQYNAVQEFTNPYGNRGYWLDPNMKKLIDDYLAKLTTEGTLWGEDLLRIKDAVYRYTESASSQHVELMQATANTRADLRNIQRTIKGDVNVNLNQLVDNLSNFSKKTNEHSVSPYIARQEKKDLNLPNFELPTFGSNGVRDTQSTVQAPLPSWMPDINKKDIEEVKQFVEAQDQLRSYLEANAKDIDEQTRKTAEMYLLSEDEMKELRKLLPKPTGGGSSSNPYGSGTTNPTNYKDMTAELLVQRRKQMKDYVNAIQTDSDIPEMLSKDPALKRAMQNGLAKDARSVIEWYNSERLKIQDELYSRHLNNEGNWKDPKNGGKSWFKLLQMDFDSYLKMLDAYYTERKAKIQAAQTEEGLSEEEAQRQIIENEQIWRQRRIELERIYLGERSEIAQDEVQAIFNILAQQDKDTPEMVEKLIDKSLGKFKILEQKAPEMAHRLEASFINGISQDQLKLQNILAKQMNAIRDIIAKERPYDGIADNLRHNLSEMGILFADLDKKRREAIKAGKEPEDDKKQIAEETPKRLSFLLSEAEHAYTLTTEEMMRKIADKGMTAWADELRNSPKMQQALLAQLRSTYDSIQEAIKKEASLLKKHAEILWNDAVLPNGQSMKNAYESTLSALGLQEDQVKRANSLIGAGQASERVADKLAIQQMKVKLAMQQQYFALIRKTGMERIAQLEAEGRLEDAAHLKKSLSLALSEEQKKVDEQRVAIQNQLEESQNRLYTELKSWAELLTSSLQSVFEASNTGNAEFYNERAKLQLTGGSGKTEQYIVIDNAGTSDATAHYETLTELEALERKHEIEQQNAMADAWKKVMDDINAKLNETITDQLNAMLQNQSVDMNTDAVSKNTEALLGLTAVINDKGDSGGSGITPSTPQVQIDTTTPGKKASIEVEGLIPGGIVDEDYVPVPYSPAQTGDNGYQFQSPWEVPEDAGDKVVAPWLQMAEANKNATETVLDNQKTVLRGEQETDKKMTASAQSMYAKMTAAMNLYGIAYQAMSNDNLSTAQKFEMIAVQAAGQAAIAALSASMSQSVGQVAAETPAVASKAWSQLGPIGGAAAVAVFTALIGGLIGFATSKIAKSKSEIAAATGAGGNSVASGRLVTGMLTYAEGNVNEFTDPSTLTPGRQYNVDAADGRTYRARYMGKNPRTHITNGPEFHLAGERGREAIIDAATTRHIQMDEVGIWRAIQTLSAGGRIGPRKIPGRGIAAFADGNLDELGDMGAMGGIGTMGGIDLVAVQASLDRNSAIQEALLERLSQPIQAKFDVYGKGGLVDSYDTGKKTAQRYGQRY